jgi:hypothetical protein
MRGAYTVIEIQFHDAWPWNPGFCTAMVNATRVAHFCIQKLGRYCNLCREQLVYFALFNVLNENTMHGDRRAYHRGWAANNLCRCICQCSFHLLENPLGLTLHLQLVRFGGYIWRLQGLLLMWNQQVGSQIPRWYANDTTWHFGWNKASTFKGVIIKSY